MNEIEKVLVELRTFDGLLDDLLEAGYIVQFSKLGEGYMCRLRTPGMDDFNVFVGNTKYEALSRASEELEDDGRPPSLF
ncbi:hypothetical protein KFU94_45560 [Chloroflexi bacterium TSY]|nr:hypothetical protein [Chloroflexi bacterium TSY]